VKRQIIKTRSRRPYIVARIIILLVLVAVIAALAVGYYHAVHHAAALRQDLTFLVLKPQSPALLS